jgi:predicted  nucleic acid-binding Zn-ribbon protein
MSPSRDFRDHKEGASVDKEIVRRIVDEAHGEEANLIVWDRRDTFTIEPKAEISVEDEYLRVQMEDGRATVYVEYDSIYKLVVEKERTARGTRAGFGATFG